MSAKRLLLIVGILIMLFAAGAEYMYLLGKNSYAPSGENRVSITPVVTKNQMVVPSPSPTKTLSYPGATEFTSPTLGIAFYYLPTQNGSQIKTKQVDNKVYIYDSRTKVEEGQSVEVFDKPANKDLIETITKRFLLGKSGTECWAVDRTTSYHYPSQYRVVEITFPKPTDSQEPWWSLGEKCSPYAQSNGIRYFLEDTKHPNKYVFFDIGQYGIMAGNRIPWQDTIQFF